MITLATVSVRWSDYAARPDAGCWMLDAGCQMLVMPIVLVLTMAIALALRLTVTHTPTSDISNLEI